MAEVIDLVDDEDEEDEALPDPRFIPITNQTIEAHCGVQKEQRVAEVHLTSIHLQQIALNDVEVIARIEAQTSNQRFYECIIHVRP